MVGLDRRASRFFFGGLGQTALPLIFQFCMFVLLFWFGIQTVSAQDRGREEKSVGEHQRLGVEYFMEGNFEASIQAFDQVIKFEPRMEARHWQRGIAYYYAGEYQKGVEQFELHQTVNSQDVENAVWHFICKTRLDGIEAAQKSLIRIQHDGRIPMGRGMESVCR